MGVHLESKADVAVLRLSGNYFGDSDADKLSRALRELIADGNRALAIDLGGVHRLNSASLGILVSAHANYVKREGRVILAQVDKHLEDLFTITRLMRVFEFEPTLSDALRELGASH